MSNYNHISCKNPHIANTAHRTLDRLLGTEGFEKMKDVTQVDTNAHMAVVEPFISELNRIKRSTRLSDSAKIEDRGKVRDKAIDALAEMDKTVSLQQGVRNLEAAAEREVDALRAEFRISDPVIQELRSQEIRRTLTENREKNPVVNPGDQDAIEKMYLEGCDQYNGEQESMLYAVESAPFPIRLIGQDIIKKGHELLQQRIAPEQTKALEEGRHRLESYQKIHKAAQDVLDNTRLQVLDGEAA